MWNIFVCECGLSRTNGSFCATYLTLCLCLCVFTGKRACVGESLARMELFIFLVSLLQNFTFSCPGGPDSINLVPEVSGFANLPRAQQIIATPRWEESTQTAYHRLRPSQGWSYSIYCFIVTHIYVCCTVGVCCSRQARQHDYESSCLLLWLSFHTYIFFVYILIHSWSCVNCEHAFLYNNNKGTAAIKMHCYIKVLSPFIHTNGNKLLAAMNNCISLLECFLYIIYVYI